MSIVVFFLMINAHDTISDINRSIRVFLISLILTFVFLIFIPSLEYGKFESGGFYNLFKVAFFTSTIDPPLITGFVLIILLFYVIDSMREVRYG
ncbi:MAG: hypothetical protein WBW71_14310, partial [Bacteroidota bacterium]